MATYNVADLQKPLHSQSFGNRSVFQNSVSVSANLANADKVRLVKVPAGTLVDRVVVKNPDLDSGTSLTIKVGFEHVDGSSGSDDDIVAAAGATTWQAAATTTYEIFPPFKCEKDSWLIATAGAAGVGTGTVYGKVEGEALGAK